MITITCFQSVISKKILKMNRTHFLGTLFPYVEKYEKTQNILKKHAKYTKNDDIFDVFCIFKGENKLPKKWKSGQNKSPWRNRKKELGRLVPIPCSGAKPMFSTSSLISIGNPQCLSIDPQCLSIDPQCLSIDPQCLSIDPQCLSIDPQCLSKN
jgi:hypothetical protein